MIRFLCALSLLFIMIIPIFGINHLDIMTTMTGEFYGSRMGYSMASLDYNGDGIKDLVVLAQGWNTTSNPADWWYGKIYFYYGGVGFDNIPDYTIEGTTSAPYSGLLNAGDVNNDGKDDLGVIGGSGTGTFFRFMLFYGRNVPQATPDFQLDYLSADYAGVSAYPLGDINHDNYDDVALIQMGSYTRNIHPTQMLLGGSLTLVNWRTTNSDITINGIGDVNHDGIDDFHMYTRIPWGTSSNNRLVVYYGSNNFPNCDSLVISNDTNEYVTEQGCPVGDVNGDGTDDFISYMGSTGKIWYGNAILTTQWDVQITPQYFGGGNIPGLVFGDLNGDGYDDIIGSYPQYGGDDGIGCLWLGGANMNGTVDWQHTQISPPMCRFGWAKATGDFNNDGLCDLAISQPNDTGGLITQGIVYVYSGNTALSDTTPIDDEVITEPNTGLWNICIYPNPIKAKRVLISVLFTGKEYKKANNLWLEIYNIKGQKLLSKSISKSELKDGKSTVKLSHFVQGNYILSIKDSENLKTTRKFSIK